MASTLSVDNIQGSASANTIDMSSVTNLHPPAGMVIQVVHGTLSGQVAVTGNNTGGADYIVDIGLNATITPRFANSRIKIDVSTYVGADQASSSGYVQSYMIYKAGSKLTGQLVMVLVVEDQLQVILICIILLVRFRSHTPCRFFRWHTF